MALRRARVPEPCRGCRFAPRCRADKLACDAAAGWAAGLSEIRWRAAPRAPTRARLEAIIEIEARKAPIRIGGISRELEKAKPGPAGEIVPSAGKKLKSATLRDAGSCGMLDVSHVRRPLHKTRRAW